jgi:hypothetical protein
MCILYIVIVILTLLDSKRKDLFKVMCILYILMVILTIIRGAAVLS